MFAYITRPGYPQRREEKKWQYDENDEQQLSGVYHAVHRRSIRVGIGAGAHVSQIQRDAGAQALCTTDAGGAPLQAIRADIGGVRIQPQ